MSYSTAEVWTIIILMGIGTFLIRFSFLGIVGDRKVPDWVLRHLRYTPVAVLPGLVAPLVAWPAATGGETDPIEPEAEGWSTEPRSVTIASVIEAQESAEGEPEIADL